MKSDLWRNRQIKLNEYLKKIDQLEKEKIELIELGTDQFVTKKIQDLENENKELREALDIDKVFLLHNYFRGVLSEENNDPIQRREDKDLFDFTLRLKQTLAELSEKGEGE